jgi:hypothetical protein
LVDIDACVYLMLANQLIHLVNKDALVIAEEVSGMPCERCCLLFLFLLLLLLASLLCVSLVSALAVLLRFDGF